MISQDSAMLYVIAGRPLGRRGNPVSRFSRAASHPPHAHASQITSAPEAAAISVNGTPMRRKSFVATV